MKHKLLSMAALGAAMLTSASAFGFEEPIAPEKPTTAGEFVSGHRYFIRNVGAGQYLTGGNAWSTQISLTRDGMTDEQNPAILFFIEDSTTTISDVEVSGYTLKLNGSFVFNGDGGTRTITNTFLFRDLGDGSGVSGFVDRASQNGWIWNITKKGDYYRLQTAAADPTYPQAAVEYAGWLSTDGEIGYDEYGTPLGSTVVTFNLTEGQEDANLDWEFIPADDYLTALDAFSAKEKLFQTLLEAQDAGVDTGAAEKVYDDPTATKDAVEQAIAELKVAIAQSQYDFSGASEDNPLDVTDQVLINPAFDTGDISGWTITVGGQNLMYQGRTDGTVDESKNWTQISGFIEAWTPNSGGLGDGTISQTVYGLPAGKYVLECDAMATRQGGLNGLSAEDAVEGAYIFIKGDDQEVREPIKAPDTQPKHWSVVYITEGSNVMTFGLLVENTTANWISADNFRLWYYGQTTQSAAQATLSEVIKTAQAAIDANEEQFFNSNADTKAALTSAIADAQSLTQSGSDDECNAAIEAVKAAKAEYDASVAAYKELDNFLKVTMEKYYEQTADFRDLNNQLYDMAEDLQDAYDNGTATTEQINEAITSVVPLIRSYIRESIDSNPDSFIGKDITLLMENPGFDTNLDGWEIRSGATPAIANGLAEVYQAAFDIHQVIPNMPAGVYEVSLQGFTRNQPGGNRMAFTEEEQTGTTFAIYTPTNTAYIQNILAGGSEVLLNQRGDETEPSDYILVDNGIEYDIAAELPDGTVIYMPNGMPSARVHFDNGGYKTTLRVVNSQPGDLDLGIRCTTSQEWCLWDDLSIVYAGMDISVYYEMIDQAAQELAVLVEAEDAFITAEGQKRLEAVNAKVENKGNITNVDEALALINEINDVKAYITEGNQKGVALKDAIGLYNEVHYDVVISDPTWGELLANTEEKSEDALSIADNDAIDALVAELKAKWPAAVLYEAGEEPAEKFDATAVIYNPKYNNYELTTGTLYEGWTIENIGGAYAANFNEMECYNNDTINVYQNIEGLKPGFYEVALQGYYRAGFPASVADTNTPEQNDSIVALYSKHNVHIHATTSLGEMTAPLMNAMEGAQEYQIGVGSESEVIVDGIPYYIPNNMEAASTYFENEFYPNHLFVQVGEDGKLTLAIKKYAHIDGDWTIFTNWQLFYLGKTGANFSDELDAIESVKATELNAAQIFGIDGRQQSALRRGINIVRTADGSVRKVLVK